MKVIIFSVILECVAILTAYGMGTLRGRITDENGEPLIGATIVIQTQPHVGCVTDFDGKYSIKLPTNSSQIILVSYVGYRLVEDTINLADNSVIIKDFTLLPDTKEIEDVVVTARAKKANESYMQLIKNKSAVSLDYISSETIKRTGDSHATDALKRITGVSTIGGYISVRGLADRYIKTAVNGLRIPTLDPITNNIKLDIFPTSLVDNIIITKTASPDLPGDWSGSYVSIETKDYPSKLSINISTTIGYNPQSTFREIVSSKRSETDWLGYDNGFRDIYRAGYEGSYPAYFKDGALSTPYNEFAALGLQDYMTSNGLTRENLGWDSRNYLDYYYRLCLVELGLLEPGLIDNYESVQSAAKQYDIQFKDSAIYILNTPVTEFGQKLPANWGTITRRAMPSFSQEISIGDQLTLFKRPLGFNLGLRYSSSTRFDPGASSNFTQSPEDASLLENEAAYVIKTGLFKSTAETNGWSGLFNLAYAFSPNHNLSAMFMPNFNGVNYVREGIGIDYNASSFDDSTYTIAQYYEERMQLVYQVHSTHYFPVPKLKVDIHASFTDGSSSIPDSKSLKLYLSGDDYLYRSSDYEYKKSTYLFEDVFDFRLAADIPIDNQPGLIRKVKFGAAYQKNIRESEMYMFYLKDYNMNDIVIDNLSKINDIFSQENFRQDKDGYYYYEYSKSPTNFGIGFSKIEAGYIMLDYAINPALRISGGLRLEYTDMLTDVRLYYELKLPDDDPVRLLAIQGGGYNLPSAKAGILKHYSYLPSLNIIYQLLANESVTVNSRINFSQTIARPSLREISVLYQEDFVIKKDIMGNPKLKIVEADNYDLRIESFFEKGDNISLSLFYKKFKNHIEMVEVPYTTWLNANSAKVYGIELEGRKILSRNFDLRANITLVKSKALIVNNSHPMFGQAPYIINAILGYNTKDKGLSAALSYNVQGRKLALVNILSSYLETSHVYEMPQHLLDLKLSKSIGNHFSVSIKIRNMLNSSSVRAYDYSHIGLVDELRYTYGTDYSLTLSYNL